MLQATRSDKKTTGLWLFKLDNVPAYCQGESIPGMTKGKIQGFEGSRVKVYKAEDEKLRNLNHALIPASQFHNFLASVFNIEARPVSWC
jgi:hypothetical protein